MLGLITGLLRTSCWISGWGCGGYFCNIYCSPTTLKKNCQSIPVNSLWFRNGSEKIFLVVILPIPVKIFTPPLPGYITVRAGGAGGVSFRSILPLYCHNHARYANKLKNNYHKWVKWRHDDVISEVQSVHCCTASPLPILHCTDCCRLLFD